MVPRINTVKPGANYIGTVRGYLSTFPPGYTVKNRHRRSWAVTEDEKRGRGRPPKDPEKGKRQNYTFRLHDSTREKLIKSAEAGNRTLSEEIEQRIEWSFFDDPAHVRAIREAGFRIVRQHGTGNTMVQVSAELLLAEADGILRSGFVAAEDIHKSPTEIMVERAVERAVERGVEKALERAGVVSAATEEPSP
jgi:hypothetical protein